MWALSKVYAPWSLNAAFICYAFFLVGFAWMYYIHIWKPNYELPMNSKVLVELTDE